MLFFSTPRFKQKFSFIIPSNDNELAILDALKVCDTVVFLTSVAGGAEENDLIDKWGQNILMSSFSQVFIYYFINFILQCSNQGLPTPVFAITDLETITQKKRNDIKQQVQKIATKWLPDEKVISVDNDTNCVNLLRRIGSQKRRSVLYRDRRPHIYADNAEFIPNHTGPYGTLKVTGYLLGASLSVNSLIHIPGIGDFQMLQIDAPDDPYSLDRNK